ncbi:MAG: pirin family protein [Saprospiraceae bacterium]
MANIQIISKAQQGSGAFNGGEIIENKPIGFPREGSSLKPYSNLFYWAHAKAVTDSTIGLHPHQGFEITSFVLKGEIRHYDTQMNTWRPLQAGDVQIIRAGNGISHSEWMGQNSEMFQIWFDPDLSKTLSQPASYDDYQAHVFPVTKHDHAEITTLVGPDSPFQMDTPGVSVQRIRLEAGKIHVPLNPEHIYSAYVIGGTPTLHGEATRESDFVLVKDLDMLLLDADAPADVFIIGSPLHPGYRTYGHRS